MNNQQERHEFRIVITPFCNYKCFFCHGEGLIQEDTPLLLSPKDYAFVVNVAKHLWGWDSVTITGGEPLVSPIYRETCEAIAGEGVRITTVTNASLLSSPRRILRHNSQVNISLHTMDPFVYKQITDTSYPLESVLSTIMAIRAGLPDIVIHLNATIVRGLNDNEQQIGALLEFAGRINAVVKFMDLASQDESLIVSCEEIEGLLLDMGFARESESTWQILLRREDERTIITRCGFAKAAAGRGYRNLFLNPDGTLNTGNEDEVTLNVLRQIHGRDREGFSRMAEWYFPPARKAREGLKA